MTAIHSSPVFLEGLPLERFKEFFDRRIYNYKSTLMASTGPVDLEFPFDVVDYLKECWKELGANKVPVKGIFLKGGSVQQILTGLGKELPDVDFTIETEPDQDWRRVERAFINAWGTIGRIKSPDTVFSLPGARKIRLLVDDGINQFALHALPTFYKKKPQYIDIQVVGRLQNSCFTSCDSLQIDIGPLVLKTNELFLIRSVDEFDVRKSLALLEQNRCVANPSRIDTLREGLRGHCRILTKGYHQDEFDAERQLWKNFLREYRPTHFVYLHKNLTSYLDRHYPNDPQGRACYLLNYYSIFKRCADLSHPESRAIEKVIIEELYSVFNLPVPSEMSVARTEIETIEAYYFFKTGKKTLIREYVFLPANEFDFLLISPPGTSKEPRLEKMLLLKQLADGDSLRAFKTRMKSPKERGQEWLNEPSLRDEGELEELVEELLNQSQPEVNLVSKILSSLLKKKPGPQWQNLFERAFHLLCAKNSRGIAFKLLQEIIQKNSAVDPTKLLCLFAQGIEKEEEIGKLIQMILLCSRANTLDFSKIFQSMSKEEQAKYLFFFEKLAKKDRQQAFDFYCQIESEILQSPNRSEWFEQFVNLAASFPKESESAILNGLLKMLEHGQIDNHDMKAILTLIRRTKIVAIKDLLLEMEELIRSADASDMQKECLAKLASWKRKPEEEEKKIAPLPAPVKKATSAFEDEVRKLFAEGKFKEALIELLKIRKPTDENIQFMSQCHAKIPASKDTIELIEKTATLFGKKDLHFTINLIVAYHVLGQKEKAFAMGDEACKSFPQNMDLRIHLIQLSNADLELIQDVTATPANQREILSLFVRSHLEKIARWTADCVRMNPTNPKYRERLAITYLQSNRVAEAIHQFKELYKINPNNESIQEMLAKCYYIQEDMNLAIQTMDASIKRKKGKGMSFFDLLDDYIDLAKFYLECPQPELAAFHYEFIFSEAEKQKNPHIAGCIANKGIASREFPKALLIRAKKMLSQAASDQMDKRKLLTAASRDFSRAIALFNVHSDKNRTEIVQAQAGLTCAAIELNMLEEKTSHK